MVLEFAKLVSIQRQAPDGRSYRCQRLDSHGWDYQRCISDEVFTLFGTRYGNTYTHIYIYIKMPLFTTSIFSYYPLYHSQTVMPMLLALEVFDGSPPPYAAHIVLELRNGTTPSDHYVQALYQDKPLILPFCNGQTKCPYQSVFREHMKKFATTADEFAALCVPVNPPPPPLPVATGMTPLEVALIGTVVVLALIIVFGYTYFSRRCQYIDSSSVIPYQQV
jgi:hypothetical protein